MSRVAALGVAALLVGCGPSSGLIDEPAAADSEATSELTADQRRALEECASALESTASLPLRRTPMGSIYATVSSKTQLTRDRARSIDAFGWVPITYQGNALWAWGSYLKCAATLPSQGAETTVTFSGSLASGQTRSLGPFAAVAGTTVTVTMTGSGDPDLYLKLGSEPTLQSWDCRPYSSSANESCQRTVPADKASVFVMVRGYAAGSYTLTVKYTQLAASASFDLEAQVVALVNQRRAQGATCGSTNYPPVPALTMNAQLRAAAQLHSQDMAARNYLAHDSQDGRSPWDRIAAGGYTGAPTAENVAGGLATAEAVVEGWMGSPGHCANIMASGSRAVGVGYAHSAASTYHHYWTQDFGDAP